MIIKSPSDIFLSIFFINSNLSLNLFNTFWFFLDCNSFSARVKRKSWKNLILLEPKYVLLLYYCKKNFSKFKSVSFSNSLKDAIKFSDLIIIHTEWNDFKSINFKKYSKNKKLIIYDLRNLYSPSKINNMGIKYYGIGR